MGTYSKKYKRKLSVLSVLTAAIFLLTGCGQSEETVYQIPEDKKLIVYTCLLYTSPSPRDRTRSRMPSSA